VAIVIVWLAGRLAADKLACVGYPPPNNIRPWIEAAPLTDIARHSINPLPTRD
jgi:hypothetical protein